MKIRDYLVCLLRLLVCFAVVGGAANNAWTAEPPDETPAQLKQGIEGRHPADYYRLAGKLFQNAASKQEAVF